MNTSENMIATKVLFSSASLKCLKPKPGLKWYKKSYSRNEFTTWSVLCHPVQPFKLTDIGEGIKEVTVKQWFVKPSQSVKQFDDLCEVESDKASVVLTSRYEGEVKSIYYGEGDIAAVGAVLLDIETEDVEPIKKETIEEKKLETVLKIEHKTKIERISENINKAEEIISIREERVLDDVTAKCLATPAVRQIAKDYNININALKGTGKGGRVTKDDILNFINQPQNPPQTSDNREIISGYRKAMVKSMTESNKIPTLTFSDEIDVTNLLSIREQVKTFAKNENVKITLLSFLVKAVSLSLQKYPILNSIVNKDCSEIEYLDYHNIGIAIDTDRGLVVPNIKDVQKLNIKFIAKEIQRLQTAAIENKLSMKDTSSGTFTISNIGSLGGTVTKPLILPPQVAIVGVGRVQKLPRFDENDQLKKAFIINVSWAADHRIVDGGTVARFSNSVKAYLENPALYIIDA